MIKQPASIFNDVIGPVMRGPSSSHVAAAARMGMLSRKMVKGNLKEVVVDFEPKGSLATTYHTQGSDMGLVGGLLNLELSDKKLDLVLEEAVKQGIKVSFNIVNYKAEHPNTYRIKVISDKNEEVNLTAISVGGGMIEIQIIENFLVSIAGDFYETLIFLKDVDQLELNQYEKGLKDQINNLDYTDIAINGKLGLLNIKSSCKISDEVITKINTMEKVTNIIELSPILPTMSRKDCIVPFNNSQDMLNVAKEKNLNLYELALLYESARGNISKKEVFEKMKEIVILMQKSIEEGLKGTFYKNRILGSQAYMIEEKEKQGKLIPGDVVNSIISSVTAMMEVKSSMGVIVAAPTAGSCGGLPGTVIGVSHTMGLSIDDMTKAMLAAGIIGVFIAEHATFAAEVGGCQVECGAGSCMAAGALVQLANGTATQGVDAASMALQNSLGMICDPVADRVEVPCLGKNVMAGVNALACANMALAGFDKVIPLDETIDTMFKVGKMLPSELRCTGCGGLSITKTSQDIYNKINI